MLIGVPARVIRPVTSIRGTTRGGLGYLVHSPRYGLCRLDVTHTGELEFLVTLTVLGYQGGFTRLSVLADSRDVDAVVFKVVRLDD